MANRTIINSPPPSPSKRIIGGSNQRSKVRFGLQNSNEWRYNHAPLDSDESKNATWWKEQAERYDTELSASGEILYGRQAIKRSLNREVDRSRLYNFDINLNKSLKGGSNQPFNKKYHLGNKTFGPLDTELNISNTLYPNTKKRVTFGVTIAGDTFTSDQTVPFSLFSSSVTSGYQSALTASTGWVNIDFANLHDDKIQSYDGEVPAQGPFTERFVGGIMARHNAPLRTTERKESFNIALTPTSPASCVVTVALGVATEDLDTTTLTLSLGGISYSATFDETVLIAASTKTIIGISDALDADFVAEAIINSLTAAITGDSLPIATPTVVGGASHSVNVVGTTFGTTDNDTTFAGTSFDQGISATSFSGGSDITRTMNEPTVGNPQGKYLRGLGAKSAVNIGNIKTLFTSDSVRIVGNFVRNYEVIQGSNRLATNMDLAFNPENYAFTIPSAFVTPPSRRTLGLTGSADYPAPRQRPSRRTNQTIIVNQFIKPKEIKLKEYKLSARLS